MFMLLLCLASSATAQALRDPTLPGKGHQVSSLGTQTDKQALVLNSIVRSENSAYAVINNKILSVGDRIQGVSLVRITPTSVVLSDGRKLVLFQAITVR
ncbi:MAG: MSHA biogenesis protein MshK [Shewanella sp.]